MSAFFQNVLAKATNTLGHIRSSGSTPKSIKTRAPYHSSQHTHAGGEIHQHAAYAETAIWEAGKASGKGGQETLLPYKECLKTITTDNGPEFAAHKDVAKYLGVPVYFADPYCSWQKGAIENTNKLIRQYIPKKDSFERYTDRRIMSIQKKLNERPREKLNFSTPKREFFKHVL